MSTERSNITDFEHHRGKKFLLRLVSISTSRFERVGISTAWIAQFEEMLENNSLTIETPDTSSFRVISKKRAKIAVGRRIINNFDNLKPVEKQAVMVRFSAVVDQFLPEVGEEQTFASPEIV